MSSVLPRDPVRGTIPQRLRSWGSLERNDSEERVNYYATLGGQHPPILQFRESVRYPLFIRRSWAGTAVVARELNRHE